MANSMKSLETKFNQYVWHGHDAEKYSAILQLTYLEGMSQFSMISNCLVLHDLQNINCVYGEKISLLFLLQYSTVTSKCPVTVNGKLQYDKAPTLLETHKFSGN